MRCTRYKRVRVRGGGIQRRCAKFGGGRARSSSSRKRRGYKRGHRPFNKGRKCTSFGVGKHGKPVCRSFGGQTKKRAFFGPRAPTLVEQMYAHAEARHGTEGLSGYRSRRSRRRRR